MRTRGQNDFRKTTYYRDQHVSRNRAATHCNNSGTVRRNNARLNCRGGLGSPIFLRGGGDMRYMTKVVIIALEEDAEYECSCDRCSERIFGPAYYVSLDNNETWCMDCAEQIYIAITDHYLKLTDDQA